MNDDYVDGNIENIILVGNSIGGFTAASTAALLAVEKDKTCKVGGLVLINSAGKIIENAGLTNTTTNDLFTAYKG